MPGVTLESVINVIQKYGADTNNSVRIIMPGLNVACVVSFVAILNYTMLCYTILLQYVLNYSFPLTVEDYVHRIGRTGRAGATGTSHTFFTDFDKGLAGALVGV